MSVGAPAKAYCLKHYCKTNSSKKKQDIFVHQFQYEKAPFKSRFQNYGTVGNLYAASDNRPSHSGCPRKRTVDLIERMGDLVLQSPKHSVGKRSQSLSISHDTCRRVLVQDLKAYPYEIQTKQIRTDSDKKQRKIMAVKILEKVQEKPTFLNLFWTSDEAHFYLEGKVNSKTNVFWGTARPNKVATKPLHPPKCTV